MIYRPGIILLMMPYLSNIFSADAPTVYAADSGGDEEEGVSLEAPDGEATLIEFVSSSSQGEENTPEKGELFRNGDPSITILETFDKNPELVSAQSLSKEAFITETGKKIKAEDKPEDTEKEDHTWLKTLVTESDNAVLKAIDQAFASLKADTTALRSLPANISAFCGLMSGTVSLLRTCLLTTRASRTRGI